MYAIKYETPGNDIHSMSWPLHPTFEMKRVRMIILHLFFFHISLFVRSHEIWQTL